MTEEYPIKSPRKLIEVALPLDVINRAAVREKSIRHGHPSTLHLWWARRPLATARAVIFAQMVNDPGYQQGGGFKYGKNKKEAAKERKRLFDIIEELVLWENTTNETVLEKARAEIRRSWRDVCELNKDHPRAAELFNPDKLPSLHDPFAGGGTIPLEARRLGLNAHASDLNPVAVLINKAMIEIPPKFDSQAPVNPKAQGEVSLVGKDWRGVDGLAEDLRYYGQWMRDEAECRIGHLYPKVLVTAEMSRGRPDLNPYTGQELTVIAWLWSRTVKSPNPAFAHVNVPLATTFVLSKKPGKEAYISPIVNDDQYSFTVKTGKLPAEAVQGTTAGKRAAFRCLVSGVPIDYAYIRTEGQAGRIKQKMMAVVAEGRRCRVYLPPSAALEKLAASAVPNWKPDVPFAHQALGFRVGNYGLDKWSDLFTQRQLVALSTFCDLVIEVRKRIAEDYAATGLPSDLLSLDDGGRGGLAYAEAISVYLAFAIDKSAVYWNSLCPWLNQPKNEIVGNSFSRQTVQMVWDFAEANPLSDSGGNITKTVNYVIKALSSLSIQSAPIGKVVQGDASTTSIEGQSLLSTDPPYYDNIGYADLSDFFYVWLRRSLRDVFPMLFATIAVPKDAELVATPFRHGGRDNAEQFFLDGMSEAIHNRAEGCHPSVPITIYYAFKQSDTKTDGTNSTGWETFLDAVNASGLAIRGTWPMRTERPGRMRDNASNALASSIVLVCRKRPTDAPVVSRREFIRELNQVLPEALDDMTRGGGEDQSPVAPVDLSQAIIGPGMAVFSKYSAVLEADGEPMTVRTALQLINRFLAEDDFDNDTQFCLHWFEQYGWDEGVFGEADVLARAKATSVDGLAEAGVIESGGGKVRLLRWSEYPRDWDPTKDSRTPIWEALHHLIRGLKQGGESAAGQLLAGVQNQAEAARQLAYRLYTLCERKGWAEDARAYNELITSWSGIETASPREEQKTLF